MTSSVPVVNILSDGQEMDYRYEVMSIDIEKTVNKITSVQATILDSNNQFTGLHFMDVSDAEFFKPGNEFEIKLRYLEQSRDIEKTVFKGILIKHRVKMSIKGAYLTLMFKDAAVGMTKVRNNVVYPQKITDTEIIEKIIKPYSKVKIGTIDVGDYQHSSEMVQYYCVDWDFMLSRAAANGRWLVCDDGKISIIAPKTKTSADFTLDFSTESYYSFDMEINILDQIPAVKVDSWNLAEQQVFETKHSQSSTTQGDLIPAELSRALGIPDVKLQSLVDIDEAEAKSWASASLLKCLLSLYRGMITLPGTTALKLGDTIAFEGLNKRFNGKTIVSGIRHQLNEEGWQTHVQFGLSAGWLQHVRIMADVDAAGLIPAINGLQVGIVQKFSKDQSGKFRIPVLVPAFSNGSSSDNIVQARLGKFDAGNKRGAFFHPEAGDEVILGFINNDPRQAIILGSMHNPKNRPPDDVLDDNAGYKYKGLVIDENMSLRFDKSVTPALIDLVASEGNKILLTATDEGGLAIETKKDMKLKPTESLNVTTKQTKLDMSESLNISTQKTDVKSQSVAITGKVDVK